MHANISSLPLSLLRTLGEMRGPGAEALVAKNKLSGEASCARPKESMGAKANEITLLSAEMASIILNRLKYR